MNPVTSVLDMAREKQSGDSAAKRAALDEVRQKSQAVLDHEKDAEELRKDRNRSIVKAAKHARATEIAEAAGIKQSYVSRVIRSGGKPRSGSALDRKREPANVG